MEFGAVLQAAQNNNTTNSHIHKQSNGRFYKASFDPPKKEARSKDQQLSLNVQKFLAKKEQEEKQKALEARKKRDEVIAKRDPKVNNKIKKMLKVIKSANKSVLEDAVDNVNTAVTMMGPDQPDEDDYGYVSQEASALYSKMMEKYKNIPEEEKFAAAKKTAHNDLASTKDRVRAAIMRHQIEENSPHKRKRKSHGSKEDDFIDDSLVYERYEKKDEREKEKPKVKRPPPPAMDFTSLLKIAEKKQFEPILIETKKAEEEEPERLMTKKQKREYDEYIKRKESKERREKLGLEKSSTNAKPESSSKPGSSRPMTSLSMKIPKLNSKSESSKSSSHYEIPKKSTDYKESTKIQKTDVNRNVKPLSKPSDRLSNNGVSKSRPENEKKYKHMIESRKPDLQKQSSMKSVDGRKSSLPPPPKKPTSDPRKNESSVLTNKKLHSSEIDPKRKAMIEERRRQIMQSKINAGDKKVLTSRQPPESTPKKPVVGQSRQFPPPDVKGSRPVSAGDVKKSRPIPPTDVKGGVRQFPPSDIRGGVRQFPPSDVKGGVRQFPPADVKGGVRQFPPADVRGVRQFPPPDVRRRERPPVKRRIEDDDSEYDSEMDDFIDDGPEEKNDYSKYIKEIFGYDKSRYRGIDDDDRNMESNFSQVMKEEIHSARVGIMEDLEDIQKEKMEKKRKMTMPKRRKISD